MNRNVTTGWFVFVLLGFHAIWIFAISSYEEGTLTFLAIVLSFCGSIILVLKSGQTKTRAVVLLLNILLIISNLNFSSLYYQGRISYGFLSPLTKIFAHESVVSAFLPGCVFWSALILLRFKNIWSGGLKKFNFISKGLIKTSFLPSFRKAIALWVVACIIYILPAIIQLISPTSNKRGWVLGVQCIVPGTILFLASASHFCVSIPEPLRLFRNNISRLVLLFKQIAYSTAAFIVYPACFIVTAGLTFIVLSLFVDEMAFPVILLVSIAVLIAIRIDNKFLLFLSLIVSIFSFRLAYAFNIGKIVTRISSKVYTGLIENGRDLIWLHWQTTTKPTELEKWFGSSNSLLAGSLDLPLAVGSDYFPLLLQLQMGIAPLIATLFILTMIFFLVFATANQWQKSGPRGFSIYFMLSMAIFSLFCSMLGLAGNYLENAPLAGVPIFLCSYAPTYTCFYGTGLLYNLLSTES
jgi:hypothetical protein